MDMTLLAGVAAAAAVAGLLIGLLIKRSGPSDAAIEARFAQLAESQAAAQRQIAEVLHSQERTLADALDGRLSKAAKSQEETMASVRERLAVIDAAQANIAELSGRVVALQEVLSNKQARGAFGEIQMKDVVETLLPSSMYRFQATLSNGKRADCMIDLPSPPGPIAVDSKFPLESFNALKAARSDAEIRSATKAFEADLKTHVAAIAEKYIVPGETADSALMFLPSEAVWAELHANHRSVVDFAFRSRVWIVSPTTLMATLHTLRAALSDLRAHAEAKRIRNEVQRLLEDLGRLDDRATKLKRHFEQADEDLRQLRISAEKIGQRGERLAQLEFDAPLAELAP